MIIKKIKYKETLAIRHKVLWPEKPESFCLLEDDPKAIHYGLFIDDELITVASIFIENRKARLRKFATIVNHQGAGYGTLVLNQIITELKESEVDDFWCDARLTAEGFYNRFLMKKSGNIFLKSGVEYIVMERKL